MPGHDLQEEVNQFQATAPGPLDFGTLGIKADKIYETPSGGGGALTLDALEIDTNSESTAATGVTVDGVLLKDAGITATGTATLTGIATFGGAAHGGLLHGAGTSSTKYTMTGASQSALSYYVTTADTADSNRCAYLRLYLTGAAGGGEAIRGFCTVGAACSVARGAHISLNYTGTSSITGESMAAKGTYHIPNSSLAAGTSAVFDAEIYADGASSSLGSGTLAMLGAHVSGNATGAAGVCDTSLAGASG